MPRLRVTQLPLGEDETSSVLALARRAADRDGHDPLPEQARLALRDGTPGTHAHVLVTTDADPDAPSGEVRVIAYAQLDLGAAPYATELVVDPDERRRGWGRVLLRAAQGVRVDGGDTTRDNALAPWSHGDLPAASAFARATGMRRVRDLHVMTRPVRAGDETAGGELPEGLELEPYRPDEDDDAWVELNAAAFADHPEQGRLTREDLRRRREEPWFDVARLLLVRDPQGPVAYLWLKQEPGEDAVEVYALGVHPRAQGRGLGGLLTRRALADAAVRGADRTILYVDGDNAPAMATYRRAWFEIARTEAQYRI